MTIIGVIYAAPSAQRVLNHCFPHSFKKNELERKTTCYVNTATHSISYCSLHGNGHINNDRKGPGPQPALRTNIRSWCIGKATQHEAVIPQWTARKAGEIPSAGDAACSRGEGEDGTLTWHQVTLRAAETEGDDVRSEAVSWGSRSQIQLGGSASPSTPAPSPHRLLINKERGRRDGAWANE